MTRMDRQMGEERRRAVRIAAYSGAIEENSLFVYLAIGVLTHEHRSPRLKAA